MYGRFMRSLVAVVLMTGAVVLSNAHPATAQAPPPPPLTEWCAAQQGKKICII